MAENAADRDCARGMEGAAYPTAMTRLVWTALIVLIGAASCGPSHPAADGGPPPDGGANPMQFVERLERAQDFSALQGEGWSVKYLGAVDGRKPPAVVDRRCIFQNTALYPLHVQFLRSFPELRSLDFDTYLTLVMKAATRVLWGGELQLIPGGVHPRTGRKGIMAYFVYADPDEPIGIDDLVALDARLKGCAPYARDLMVLVAADPQQGRDFAAKAAALAARGVAVADLATLRPVVGAEGYSLGEGYGYLRVVPRGIRPKEWGPRDILVTEGSFEELGLVAGLLTAQPQNLHSHVNLRLREKKIPNASVPDVYDNQAVVLLDGKLGHLTVTEHEARLVATTIEEAEAFWASRHPAIPPLTANLDETRLRDFSVLTGAESSAYGVKAANLGELFRVLPPENRGSGFGIPFSVHRDFVQGDLAARVGVFLADPRTKGDASFRRGALRELQKAMEVAPLPAGLMERLRAAAQAAFGDGFASMPIRFRSSSNAEDGEFTSGAGLYDSYRGCFADDDDGDDVGPSRCLSDAERAAMQRQLDRRIAELTAFPERSWLPAIIDDLTGDLSKERPVVRAVRKAYASLWNERAFEDREYWGMDHTRAFMGLAVNSSFVLERLDAVALTNLPVTGAAPLYRVISQRDGNPVVRPPDPTLVAEVMTFRRGPDDRPIDVEVITHSSLSAEPLWSDTHMIELGRLLAKVQDHFSVNVYPQIPTLSLDLEIKITEDDRVVIKQARPYFSAEPASPTP